VIAPEFSILTPSFNMLTELRKCAASVSDQQGVTFEHIVMDGGSNDGTPEWLARSSSITAHVGLDSGMYDALNKGFALARASIVGHLNCDEQYLPGTLQSVQCFFDAHSEIDVVYGDVLFVNRSGVLLAFRKAYPLRAMYIENSSLYAATCGMFYRRRILDRGFRFDPQLKSVSDGDLVIRLLRAGIRFAHFKRYCSTFTLGDRNLSWSEIGVRELKDYRRNASLFSRLAAPPLLLAQQAERLLSGALFSPLPIEYEIFTDADTTTRTKFISRAGNFSLHPERFGTRLATAFIRRTGDLLTRKPL